MKNYKMGKAYLLIKENKFTHTYSEKLKNKMVIDEGWICVGNVYGWNMSWFYSNEEN